MRTLITKRARKPTRPQPGFTVLDIETRATGEVLAIGIAWYDYDETGPIRCYAVYTGWAGALKFLQSMGRKYPHMRTVYAHNGANFDFLSLMQYAAFSDLFELKRARIIQANGRGIGADITLGKNGTLRLRDSAQLLPAPLAQLAADLGCEHTKQPIDVLPETLYQTDPAGFHSYLRSDCFALQDILAAFYALVRTHIAPIDRLAMTTGGQALTLWRDYFLDVPIMPTWAAPIKDIEKSAYVGGRVECFQPGLYERVFIYDVNSQYPAVMRSEQYPLEYAGYWVNEYEPGRLGIYEIDFTQTNTAAPPVLLIGGNGVYTGSGTYCSPEIDLLLATGGHITVKRGYVYLRTGNPFAAYIDRLYALKQTAGPGLRYVCKILLNALYGKFGQRGEQETIEYCTGEQIEQYLSEGKRVTEYGDFCTVAETVQIEHQFFALGAFITSYARCNLYRYMLACKPGSLVYVDTDSIHTTSEIDAALIGPGLGLVKLEAIGAAAYAGKKLYGHMETITGNERIKVAGIPARAGLDFASMAHVASGGTLFVQYETPATVRETILENDPACSWKPRHKTIYGRSTNGAD